MLATSNAGAAASTCARIIGAHNAATTIAQLQARLISLCILKF
jgi:hypothetical protein